MQRLFIFCLLKFMLFGFSCTASDSSSRETSSLDNYEQAIWNIRGFDEDLNEYSSGGTGFFVGPNQLITNLHVISSILNGAPDHIVLLQEGSPSVLKVNKVLAASVMYDLVLLETEEEVANYLSLREKETLEPDENLFILGYPGGIFEKIRKIGRIFYENDKKYTFHIYRFDISGASGSPVLDEQGQVVGVVFRSKQQESSAIKINHLREFIRGNIGTDCSKHSFNAKNCLTKEKEHLKELAEEGSMYAQETLAIRYHEGRERYNLDCLEKECVMETDKKDIQRFTDCLEERDLDCVIETGKKAMQWFKKAAEQGLASAQHELAGMYGSGWVSWQEGGIQRDENKAIYWTETAAEQGYAEAQFSLAHHYLYDWEEKDVNNIPTVVSEISSSAEDVSKAIHLYEIAAEQGYIPSQTRLACIYYYGVGVQKDLNKASQWSEKAKELNNDWDYVSGCHESWSLDSPPSPLDPPDPLPKK